ncbi:hypothetical protein [Rhizobium sp. BK008]|uniref:hypothetical protein n=1 Tax=Rhizobium sp. BK008 TaxID=2587094 RepID=UPI001404C0D7|nr:hypothetical protein [Rhizobium sp. BK008]MBB4249269.1 hypothetical protein [Rhizobium sp. BK008]
MEEIGNLVKADKALRQGADQPVSGEGGTVSPPESREQMEVEARKLRHPAKPFLAVVERNPPPSASEGENAASTAQSSAARSRLVIFISSYGRLRIGPAALRQEAHAGGSAKTASAPASKGSKFKKHEQDRYSGKKGDDGSRPHSYVAALITSSREIGVIFIRHASHAGAAN